MLKHIATWKMHAPSPAGPKSHAESPSEQCTRRLGLPCASRVLGSPGSSPSATRQIGGVFYATLYLERGTERIEVDSRPSDAIALAVRTGAPIDVDEVIFANGSVRPAL